jgi:CubicO group peptidase (beta-lactamase class C family)
MKHVRTFAYLLAALLLLSCTFTPQALQRPSVPQDWPTQGWQPGTPEEQGIDSAKLAEALLAMREQKINIHSFLLIRNGKVVVDAYFYPYDGSTIHDLASVTKSIMPALVAIAADQGKLDLDAPLVSFFPEYQIANRDARKERLTIRHLASMVNGMDSVCKENDEGTLREMVESPDFVQFALDRKMLYEPGTHFCYDSPGMHLLSAILQQATGMTAFGFARQNLFESLGIENALWESDPQGVNDGWGDLYLHPHDMAKIGYLWLNAGVWDGEQIIPREWVKASVTPQMTETGEDDVYGYGWWLSRGNDLTVYSANGRGGQHIKVVPEWNLIAVTTGGGFDFSDIDPLVVPTLVDMEKPLPANPEGVAQLEAAVKSVVEPPKAQPVVPLPDIAREISGKTFVFEPNPTEMETSVLEFDDSAEATLHIKSFGSEQVVSSPIGLDGIYRMSPGDHNLPQGYRGYWADSQTFILEYDNIANNDHATYRLHFEGDRVLIGGQETSHALGTQFEGYMQNP